MRRNWGEGNESVCPGSGSVTYNKRDTSAAVIPVEGEPNLKPKLINTHTGIP